jgi:hypothetical protein
MIDSNDLITNDLTRFLLSYVVALIGAYLVLFSQQEFKNGFEMVKTLLSVSYVSILSFLIVSKLVVVGLTEQIIITALAGGIFNRETLNLIQNRYKDELLTRIFPNSKPNDDNDDRNSKS